VTYLIFIGDMVVMAFMVALVVWVSVRANNERIDCAARIPLEDERHD
jgi:cbb3-type cytochrome oxidase subunit 3